MQVAHVICCNDSVQFVVMNDLVLATAKLAELKQAYFEQNKSSFAVIVPGQTSEQIYNQRCYWHIRSVEGI